ncbi:monovalent cation:proton antiporter-2 (CPA2) family protein [Echinimonas agarilytica]|uniref:Monovalent cation:proton antiporter-2 (CPA2) family protein n=1 Tax=Echinimonas agarilytica TaxID=1215918 RepID=A0AA41W718_9GAMM|nr:monovalent cation:proton antiporter-2 (CPA2) family protein [Echinimonas agarilytica]
MTGYLLHAFVYLCAAVIAVPIAKRLGLGSVLGYLVAGVVIGPVLGFVGQETATIQHFAEFGVVMMLFLVGLELEPKMLWAMKHRLLGLGGLQVTLSTLVFSGCALYWGIAWQTAVAIGLLLSLSSTAIVLQTFNEKGLSKTDGGRSSFSVLLFQDIAVIPMLAVIPLLAIPELLETSQQVAQDSHGDSLSLVAHLTGWHYALVVVGAIAAIIASGRFLSRHLFHFIAASGLREVFTAAALMLVIGVATLMGLIGLSPALGTFLAGVVLANSDFRHELEANVEPFKGLLLGLFFITVGAGIQFSVLVDEFAIVIGITLAVISIKAAILFVLALIFKVRSSDGWLLALSLSQAGEFGFVLINFTVGNHVLPPEYAQILSLVVALSMFLTPGLFILYDRLILPRYQQQSNAAEQDVPDSQGQVIIAGVGRFGQIVNRLLVANDIPTVVLDAQAGQVDLLRNINIKSYFGDATRPELLETVGIDEASLFVVAIDNKIQAVELVTYLKHAHPHLKILARAFDRGHSYELEQAGADVIISETYYSALAAGEKALSLSGIHPFRAQHLAQSFVEIEQSHHQELYESWQQGQVNGETFARYREIFKQLQAALDEGMEGDRLDGHSDSERGWTPPPKGYIDKL